MSEIDFEAEEETYNNAADEETYNAKSGMTKYFIKQKTEAVCLAEDEEAHVREDHEYEEGDEDEGDEDKPIL